MEACKIQEMLGKTRTEGGKHISVLRAALLHTHPGGGCSVSEARQTPMIVSNASLRLRPQGVRVKLPPAPTLHSWGNNT